MSAWLEWFPKRVRRIPGDSGTAEAPIQPSYRAHLQSIADPFPEGTYAGLTDTQKTPHQTVGFITRWPVVALLLGVAASTIFKLVRLDARELSLDESRSAFFATLSFHDLIRYCLGDTAPPLYHILLWCWVRLHFISSLQADLRIFSVLLSVLATLGMFTLALTWLGTQKSAAFAALLFASSPILFFYSFEVRQYMLLVCCTIAVLIVHHRVAAEPRATIGVLLLYSLLAVLLFYCHYIGLFILFGLLLDWLVATRLQKRRLAALCFVVAIVLLAAAPWAPIMVRQHDLMQGILSNQIAGNTDPSSLSFGSSAARLSGHETASKALRTIAVNAGFFPVRSRIFTIILAAPLVAALAGIALLMVKGDRICRMLAWVFLLTGIGLFWLGMNANRYLLPLIPPLILAITRVAQSWSKSKRWGTAGLLMASFILCIYIVGFIRQSVASYQNPWHDMMATLQPAYRDGDVVLFDALYGQVPFDIAARQKGLEVREDGFPETIYRWWNQQPATVWGGPVLRESDLDATTQRVVAATKTKTVWLVLYEVDYYDPHDRLLMRFRELGNAKEVFQAAPPPSLDLPEGIGLRLVRVSLPR